MLLHENWAKRDCRLAFSSCTSTLKKKIKNRLPRPCGFYSNGNNECNRNELGRQLINQHDAL